MTNWKTTVSGLMAGLPPIIIAAAAGSGVKLSPYVSMGLAILSGVGALLTGLSAKDSTTHSTQSEVAVATVVDKVERAEGK